MHYYKLKVYDKIKEYVKMTYPIIDYENMKMGKGLFNNRCHSNAVQNYYEHEDRVFLCMAMSEDYNNPIVHFINKTEEGFFVDNTLGYEYKKYEYYIIREIKKSEFNNICDILYDTKDYFLDKFSNKFIRKILGRDIVI